MRGASTRGRRPRRDLAGAPSQGRTRCSDIESEPFKSTYGTRSGPSRKANKFSDFADFASGNPWQSATLLSTRCAYSSSSPGHETSKEIGRSAPRRPSTALIIPNSL
jgi:hypothetical protein